VALTQLSESQTQPFVNSFIYMYYLTVNLRILMGEEPQTMIGWAEDGCAFIVPDPDQFSRELLPQCMRVVLIEPCINGSL
jgi:hypothetical protein